MHTPEESLDVFSTLSALLNTVVDDLGVRQAVEIYRILRDIMRAKPLALQLLTFIVRILNNKNGIVVLRRVVERGILQHLIYVFQC